MSRLEELQRLFGESIVREAPLEESDEARSAAEEVAAGSHRLSPLAQLSVYREQFWIRHVGCLAEDYATLQALLGETGFETLVAAYLGAHPPTKFRLRDLGERLPSFVAERSPWAEDALLADVARVEWAFVDAYDAADAPPLDAASLGGVAEDAWSGARLTFHPSLQPLALRHPANDLRIAFRTQQRVERPEPADTFLVIYRRDLLLYAEALDELAFALLTRLMAGETLGEAGERVGQSSGRGAEVEAKIGEWFARWASLGWLSRIEF